MEKSALQELLFQAERHVADSHRHVADQREILARLESSRCDTALARELLEQLLKAQTLHEDHLAKLRRGLEDRASPP